MDCASSEKPDEPGLVEGCPDTITANTTPHESFEYMVSLQSAESDNGFSINELNPIYFKNSE